MGTAYFRTLQFNRDCEATPIAPATRSARLCSASLPFALARFVESSSVRFQLEPVVRALPSLRRSQSADRFCAIHQPDRGGGAVARTRRQDESTLAAFLPGHPQATFVIFILTRSNLLRSRSAGATPSLAIGQAARFPATQSRTLQAISQTGRHSITRQAASLIPIQQQQHPTKPIAQQVRRMLV